MNYGLFTVGVCGMLSYGALGEILHDTTVFDIDTNWLVGLTHLPNINQPSDSFQVKGGDFTLDSLTLRLSPTEIGGANPDDYEVRVWKDADGIPGVLLESMTVSDSSLLDPVYQGVDVTLLSTANSILQEGMTYWVSVALPDDLSTGSWWTVDSPSNGRAIAFSGSEDTSWLSSSGNNAFYLQVTGTAVPEPGAMALIGIGGLVMGRRRR